MAVERDPVRGGDRAPRASTSAFVRRTVARALRAFIRYLPPYRRGMRLLLPFERLLPPVPGERLKSRERAGMTLYLDPADPFERMLYYRGLSDPYLHRWLRRWIRPGDIVVDVGAHIGSFVGLVLPCVGSTGRIYAYEPHPVNIERLRSHFPKGVPPNVVLEQVAVAGARAERSLYTPASDSSMSYLATLTPTEGYTELANVPVRPLDELVPGDAVVRLLKIDVEGHELDVVAGAEGLLSEARVDAVMIEINPAALARAGASPRRLLQAIASHGYVPHRIAAHGLERLTVDARFERHAFEDVVCIRPAA